MARQKARIGDTAIWKRGTLKKRYICISNTGKPHERWKLRSVYRWTTYIGPIPKGCVLVHVDGNHLNDELPNLAVVPRKAPEHTDERIRKRTRKIARKTKERHAIRRCSQILADWWYPVVPVLRIVIMDPSRYRKHVVAKWNLSTVVPILPRQYRKTISSLTDSHSNNDPIITYCRGSIILDGMEGNGPMVAQTRIIPRIK